MTDSKPSSRRCATQEPSPVNQCKAFEGIEIYALKCPLLSRGDPTTPSERSREIRTVAIVVLSVVLLGAITVYVAPVSTHLADDTGATSEEDDTGATSGEIQSVVDANNQFALELYFNIIGSEEGNIFFSPYSISTVLAMIYEGARGETAEEIQSVFHFPANDTERRSQFSAIYGELNMENTEYMLRTANALWIQEGYPILDEFITLIEEYYAGKVTNVDFIGATEQARQTINEWVESRTNNKITDFLPSDLLDTLTRLVLTNALYFNGTWVNQFSAAETAEGNFKVSADQTVRVPMMRRTDGHGKFNFADVGDLQVLEMLYKGGDLSMLVLLPKENDLSSLEDSLTLRKLNQWRNELGEQVVDVYVPKFAFTTEYRLDDNLKEMGMPSAFSFETADLSGMDGTRDLWVKTVVHKAVVSVNERGTEAAAATGGIITLGGAIGVPVFRADHPFMFMIQERVTGNILFLGRVVNPAQ